MKGSLALVLSSLLNSLVQAAVIPAERLVHWDPGVRGGIPDVPVTCNLKEYHPAADGKTDDSAAFRKAIADCAVPGALKIPAGTYVLKRPLDLKSGLVLRGEGPDRTRLIFDLPDAWYHGAISMTGAHQKKEHRLTGGAAAGSRRLTLDTTAGLKAGQLVWIYRDNDPDVMYTRPEWKQDWSENSVGQIVGIQRVEGSAVNLDAPLRLDYASTLHPRLVVLHPMTFVGVENLHIKRLDQAEDFIVQMKDTENCWVRNCEFEYCHRAHVSISRSKYCTVEGTAMHHAWNYGGGGHGYGVNVGHATSDCLITNNVFWSLRHSMLVQVGANANVFSYNYSTGHKLCDISIHGHFSYMNLFEGNVVQFIQYADWWGPTGPRTTCFRNRVMSEGIRVNDSSHRANVVGNTVPEGHIRVHESVEDLFLEANRVQGKLIWNTRKNKSKLRASLYLDGPPHFWGKRPWPGIGADVDDKNPEGWIAIPAQERYRLIRKK